MDIRVIYRNYRPLHSTYTSFTDNPLSDIHFSVPSVNPNLRLGYSINRKFRYIKSFRFLVNLFQDYYFRNRSMSGDYDGYFFAGILPEKSFNRPFVLDFEHVYALFDYGVVTDQKKDEILRILLKKNCLAILPWSSAAEKTLLDLYPSNHDKIKRKTRILYPALPDLYDRYKDKVDQSYIKTDTKILNLLFIGKEYRRKGLIEILEAFMRFSHDHIKLYVVSSVEKKDKEKYSHRNIQYIDPTFTLENLVKYFFMPADMFIMPTHADTFGMVYLESLASGTPIIATKQFAIPEILEENVNGFFVDSEELFLEKGLPMSKEMSGSDYSKIEDRLVESIYTLLNKLVYKLDIVKEMQSNCRQDFIDNGRFSLKTRNTLIKTSFHEH